MSAPRLFVFPYEAPDASYVDAAVARVRAYDQPDTLVVVAFAEVARRLERRMMPVRRRMHPIEGATLVRTGGGRVHEADTARAIAAAFEPIGPGALVIVAGGDATDEYGSRGALKPDGVDFTATLLARYLNAREIVLWSVSDGVPSADPRLAADAFPLLHLSFREASEIVYPNTGLFHPRTLIPLFDRQIPIFIRSVHRPDSPGTRIDQMAASTQAVAKAVTAIPDTGLVVIEGAGMMGIPGIAARALGAIAAAKVNIVMLSQASTEQSIGIIVTRDDLEAALAAAEAGLAREIERGEVQRLYALPDLGVVTVVDDNMRYRPGLTGRMFATLGRAGINVLTMAEGASETNISAVVAETDLKRAVQALHEAFAQGRQRAHVFLFGAGTVGSMVLKMMGAQAAHLARQLNLHLQLVGIATTRGLLWNVDGIAFDTAIDTLRAASEPHELDAIVEHLIGSRLDRLIVIDATASDAVTQVYPKLLEHNIAVVTPNKRANTQSMAFYDRLRSAARERQVPYFYETTVGAGLPIISTLRDLIRSGDEIIRIEGVLSGTLSYVFNHLSAGEPLAEVIRAAHRNGFTEPDPRDDLSGEDVARKLLILAREMGLSVERTDVDVESLVPDALVGVGLEVFWEGLERGFSALQERADAARAAGRRLHYVASIQEGRLCVGVQAPAVESPLNGLSGTDNLIAFTTRRYRKSPLVVRGAGAGPEVTAAGILAEVIKAAELVT